MATNRKWEVVVGDGGLSSVFVRAGRSGPTIAAFRGNREEAKKNARLFVVALDAINALEDVVISLDNPIQFDLGPAQREKYREIVNAWKKEAK